MSQFVLKLIALVAMLVDHSTKGLMNMSVMVQLIGYEPAWILRKSLIGIGHTALPVFAWFTAEGCRKTSNPAKYLARLGVFAVISEIPFQLYFTHQLQFGCTNVMFTLLLGASAILLNQWLKDRDAPVILLMLPPLLAMALGWFLHTDYNAWGVGLILLMYYLPTKKLRLIGLAIWVTVFRLIWHGWNGETFLWLTSDAPLLILEWAVGMLAVPLLAGYSGKRGGGSKWLFYWFYPCHLTVLYCLWKLIY